jgi:peptide/nickel transport system ATP-binding protein
MTGSVKRDEAVLRVRDLCVSFNSPDGMVPALDGVSFEIAAGETLAIVGESGSGKTVTALALMRLLEPSTRVGASEIMFDGIDLLRTSEAQMRDIRGNRIAMIFQDPMSAMNPSMTVGAQIAEPLVRHRNLAGIRALSRAEELCTEVQIQDAHRRLSQYPHQFSGGMRQRAMIAMALGCRPKLIIADEPTTALDVTVQAQVLRLLKELAGKSGSSLILITHDLGLVARHADRVCIMYAGRVVETGSVRQLFKSPAHPYTRGLLASIPRLDRDVPEHLTSIPGQPPVPGQWPPGCAFHPRCNFAVARCQGEQPQLEAVADQQWRSCFVDLPRIG